MPDKIILCCSMQELIALQKSRNAFKGLYKNTQKKLQSLKNEIAALEIELHEHKAIVNFRN